MKYKYKDNEESSFIPTGSLEKKLDAAYERGIDNAIKIVYNAVGYQFEETKGSYINRESIIGKLESLKKKV